MSVSLGFNESGLSGLRQNFYYHSNIKIDESLEKNLNFSGFSENEESYDFIIESSSPLIIKIDDQLVEVKDIEDIEDIIGDLEQALNA